MKNGHYVILLMLWTIEEFDTETAATISLCSLLKSVNMKLEIDVQREKQCTEM